MLQKLTAFTKTVAGLPDVPSPAMSALQLKQWFDTAPEEQRVAFNALIDSLLSTVAGDSGAKNIGVETMAGVTGNNVQAVLQDLKQQINGAIAGSIPDGSITQAKLAFAITTNAAGVSIADTGAHFTATNVEGALDELFTSASSVKTNVANAIGAPATSSDTGTVLANRITTEKGRLAAEIGDGNSTSTLQYLADRLIVRSDAIATAVNSKGVAASSADTLAQLAAKVGQIVLGRRVAWGSLSLSSAFVGADASQHVYFQASGFGFTPSFIIANLTFNDFYVHAGVALYDPNGWIINTYDVKSLNHNKELYVGGGVDTGGGTFPAIFTIGNGTLTGDIKGPGGNFSLTGMTAANSNKFLAIE